MITSIVRHPLLFCFFVIMGFLVCFSHNVEARLVVVIYGQDNVITTQEEARSFAVVEALLAEAEDYLVQRIPEERRASVRQYLHMLSQGLVTRVVEIDEIELNEEKKRTTFDVSIRKNALYTLLCSLGTTYTLYALQPYVLEGEASELTTGSIDIGLLEKVSGVTQCVKHNIESCPKLYIQKEGNSWTAVLTPVNGEPIREVGFSLDTVWRGVWSKFFIENQKQHVMDAEEYILQVWGWNNGSGVEELEQSLGNWVSCVKDVVLHDVSIKNSIVAQWTITITDKKLFEEKITLYTLAHKLEYAINHKTSAVLNKIDDLGLEEDLN